MPRYSRAEQETVIRFDEEDKTLDIYTISTRMARYLMKRGYSMQTMTNPQHGWRLKGVPLSALTFRRIGPALELPGQKREWSDSERTQVAQRLKQARNRMASEASGPSGQPPA